MSLAPRALENELLEVMRSRLSESSVERATVLLEWLGFDASQGTEHAIPAAIERITRAVEHLPPDLAAATRLMCGLDDRTRPARTTRKTIVGLMAAELPRQSRTNTLAAEPLTHRAVTNIEREDIVPEMIRVLERRPDQRQYRDVDVRVVLRATEHHERVFMSVQLTATVASRHWIVAVTHDELLAERICRVSAAVNEVVCPALVDATENVLPRMRLSIHPEVANEARGTVLPMEEKTPRTIASVAGEPFLEPINDARWFCATFPEGKHEHRLTFVNEQDISYADRYCFWNAGRATFLRSIVIDASGFPAFDQHNFYLQTFIGAPIYTDGQEVGGIFTLRIDSWVEPGHGVALIWGDR